MLLNDKEIWETLNELWEDEESGASTRTYPDDPILRDAKQIAKAQLRKVAEAIGLVYDEEDKDLRLALAYLHQSILKEVE